jgi:hypothetical protein
MRHHPHRKVLGLVVQSQDWQLRLLLDKSIHNHTVKGISRIEQTLALIINNKTIKT